MQINNCLDIVTAPVTGCSAKWTGTGSSAAEIAASAAPENPEDIIPSPLAELQAEAQRLGEEGGTRKAQG